MIDLLSCPALHEFYAARADAAAAVTGLAWGLVIQPSLTRNGAETTPGTALWVRHSMAEAEYGAAYLPGLHEYGCDPARLILVRAGNVMSLLQAALEGARTAGLGAVLVEIWGEASAYDLTASRRLAMAAKAANVTVLIARVAASPQPSAAQSRWQVQPLPSCPLPARAPGPARFFLSLQRSRQGREGMTYILEWNRDERRFAILDADAGIEPGPLPRQPGVAPLPGAVAAFPFRRPVALPGRRAG